MFVQSCFSQTIITPESYFDYLRIAIIANGDIVSQINCRFIELPFYIPSLPSSGVISNSFGLHYIVNSSLKFMIRLDLYRMSESEADIHAAEIERIIEDWIGIEFENTRRTLKSINHPNFGTLFFIDYEFVPRNLNHDVVIDKFLSLMLREGFTSLISRRIISSGDNFILNANVGSKFCKFTFVKIFKNYFNFRVGNTYTLDLFKLFNFTGPLKIHSKSENGSQVEIYVLSYAFDTSYIYTTLQAEIINIELPFEYRVTRHIISSQPLPPSYCINNYIPTSEIKYGVPKYSLTAGNIINYMRITFKIVEYGSITLSLDLSFKIMVILIIFITCTFILVVILKAKKYRVSSGLNNRSKRL